MTSKIRLVNTTSKVRGGSKQCCLAGCINDTGSYPLTACRGSYEVKGQSLQPDHMCFERYSWVRENHVNNGMGEIAYQYIPCCLCQKNIKCFWPYGCSHHMSNFLNSTFHVTGTCNNGEYVSSTRDVPSMTRNKNFLCCSFSEGLEDSTS